MTAKPKCRKHYMKNCNRLIKNRLFIAFLPLFSIDFHKVNDNKKDYVSELAIKMIKMQ